MKPIPLTFIIDRWLLGNSIGGLIAMESSIAGETLGGTFGIRMTDTTYNPSLEISKESITQISESTQPVEVKQVKPKDIEEELIKLKSLYDKGLIDEVFIKKCKKSYLVNEKTHQYLIFLFVTSILSLNFFG